MAESDTSDKKSLRQLIVIGYAGSELPFDWMDTLQLCIKLSLSLT